MSDYQQIGKLRLKNQGGFVVKMDFLFGSSPDKLSRLSGSRKDITLGFSETNDPGDYNIHSGDYCTVYADVAAGKDKSGQTIFIYQKDNKNQANFTISGTTLDNELGFNGITES